MLRRTLLGSPIDIEGPGGNRIACQVAGPLGAQPVILTSGIGCGPVFFRDLGPELARTYRTVFWNFRAHGESSLVPDGRSYHIPDHAADLDAVVRAFADRPPVMVGFSMGVQVILEWIRHYEASGALAFVFLFGTPYNPLRSSKLWGNARLRRSVETLLNAGADRVLSRLHFLSKAVLRNRLSYALAKRIGLATPDFTWRDYFEFINYSTEVRPDAYLRTAIGLLEHDAHDIWETLNTPVMYVWGGSDPLVPPDECRRAAQTLEGAETGELAGRSHAGAVEAGPELARRARRFIDEHVGVRGPGQAEAQVPRPSSDPPSGVVHLMADATDR